MYVGGGGGGGLGGGPGGRGRTAASPVFGRSKDR